MASRKKKQAPIAPELIQPFDAFDVEMEQAIIGSALVHKDAIETIECELKPADFGDPLHRRIIERVFVRHKQGAVITPLSIGQSLKNDAGLIELGGTEYLAACADLIVTAQILRGYCRQIVKLRAMRDASRALMAADDRLRAGEYGEDPVTEALEGVVAVFDENIERINSMGQRESILQTVDGLMSEWDGKADLPCAPTGIAELDQAIGGWGQGYQVFVGGRPGMGKSILGTTSARAAALAGWCVDYFSMEMSRRELVARMICDQDYDYAILNNLPPLKYENLLMKRVSQQDVERVYAARDVIADLDIEIHEKRTTFDKVAGTSRARASRTDKKQLIITDHLHLILPSGRYEGRKVDELSEITAAGKELAKQLNASLVQLAQLTREVEHRDDKRPQLSDFRDSGSIEQDGDQLWGVYRPEKYLRKLRKEDFKKEGDWAVHEQKLIRAQNRLFLPCLKNRHGAEHEIECFINVASSTIRSITPTTASQAQISIFDADAEGYRDMMRF